MNNKVFTSVAEADKFAKLLLDNPETIVNIVANLNGKITVYWVESKYYTKSDGTVCQDEIYTTEDYSMIAVQDLSEDEAKNILRRMIKDSKALSQAALELLGSDMFDGISASDTNIFDKPTLH